MAFRRLYPMLDKFNNADAQGIRNTAGFAPPTPGDPAFVQRANIISVNQRSGATVLLNGNVVFAYGATDEPFRAGDEVWVATEDNGTIILLGSVK